MACSVCGKGTRARYYCQKMVCGFPAFSAAREPLPPPEVNVTPAVERDSSAPPGSVDVVISRGGKAISHRAEGGSTTAVVKDAFDKFLADHRAAEYVK